LSQKVPPQSLRLSFNKGFSNIYYLEEQESSFLLKNKLFIEHFLTFHQKYAKFYFKKQSSKQRRKPFCFFNLSDIQSVFFPFKKCAFPGIHYFPEKGAVYKYNLIKPQKKRKKKMRKGFRSFSK
jgi:hypothetical protein